MSLRRLLSLTLVALFIALAQPATRVTAAGNDPDAGRWRMIVLSSPTQFAVPPPGQAGGPGYQAELAAIKSAQASVTPAQRKSVEVCGRGNMLPRSEIMLATISRSNLPPAPRADDT